MAERYRIDQRAALFGSRHGAKKAPVAATQIGAGQSQDAEALERQNEGHISELEARVSALKEITQSVGREVRESGSLIDSMNAGVAQAATTLRGTVSQLTQATSGRRDRTAALTGGFLLIFLIMHPRPFPGAGISRSAFAASGPCVPRFWASLACALHVRSGDVLQTALALFFLLAVVQAPCLHEFSDVSSIF
ncbi:unnamed protein product [Prorocentrum cordatum]|uniref:t-SNARE coiled-coil homology domain-containing protein n=1 Tax=Prorocentrum cordatum TaxID=2364126 RepID=A0ABN9Y198_9DINO|nr:unnamed protein product [Polarella glacialis]